MCEHKFQKGWCLKCKDDGKLYYGKTQASAPTGTIPNKSKPSAPAPASTPATSTRSKSTIAGAPAPVLVDTNGRAPVPAPAPALALITESRPQGPRQGGSRGFRFCG